MLLTFLFPSSNGYPISSRHPQLSSLPFSHHCQPSSISFLLYRSCFHLIPTRRNCDVKQSIVCCVSTKKSRCFSQLIISRFNDTFICAFLFSCLSNFYWRFLFSSRKLMSDADLCNSIREFVASVGLPEGHVPSIKELAEHGRFVRS